MTAVASTRPTPSMRLIGRDRLAAHGLEITVPGAEDRALVHRVIYDELCRGIVPEESRCTWRPLWRRR